MRKRGGILGPKKTVTASSAVGFWDLTTLQQELGEANWPGGPVFVDYLVVAGGGGSMSGSGAGGGGAGGMRSTMTASGGSPGTVESRLVLILNTNYTVTVGGGGAGGTGTFGNGTNGSNSVFSSITSLGGAASRNNPQLTTGVGSGSGAAGSSAAHSGGIGTSGQGYNGGNNAANGATGFYAAGGGGGAGAVGGNGNTNGTGGTGGAGVTTSITGSSVTYAGGGGGGTENGGTSGTGGVGGGGNAGTSGNTLSATGTAGTANLGGGAGGTAGNGSTIAGAAGGSGVVILRYSNLYTMTVGAGLAYSTQPVGNDKVTTFTGGSGNISLSPAPVTTGDYESIATVLVGSAGASTVTFSNIPQTYKHLQIRGILKCSSGSSLDAKINGDIGSLKVHYLYGNGSVTAAGLAGGFFIQNTSTSQFSLTIIDILDYTDTNKYRVVRALGGYDNNGSGELALISALYNTTSSINSITFYPTTSGTPSGNFVQYSSFALYGIRG